MTPADPRIAHLLDVQDGVVSRRQALEAGLSPTEIARRLRRGEWIALHTGVYVNHNGPLTWQQRAWAAVHACWPAALADHSARRAHEGPGRRASGDAEPIRVVIAHGRTLQAPAGVLVRRSRRLDDIVQWNLSPPRMRYDDALLAIADGERDDIAAIAVLADACGGRRTTATRLLAALDSTARLRRRTWLTGVLADVAEGTCSVLEHGYLTRVERAHGLPRGLRQVADSDLRGRGLFRDVRYGGERPHWRQIVELDGRLWHDSVTDRERDLDRDLDAAIGQQHTVRLGFGQVFGRSCWTAWRMARLFTARGWRGTAHGCPACPPEIVWLEPVANE